MKVSINWLKDLVNINIPFEEIIKLYPLRTIGLKDVSDHFMELDMKGYNRPDLLSMRGVALETAAIINSIVKFEDIKEPDYIWVDKSFPDLKVEVENQEFCPVYCLAKIEGLKVNESPKEWVEKLKDSGMRTVNNLADITNLVMLEYGQPLHSFDAGTVKDETVIVRTAREDEEIKTLDDKLRKLESSDLMIADPEKNLGIAGVMGGKNSEVTEKTTSILLEAAIFDPINLRKTATRLNLNSEASKRFQHGLTLKRLLQALDSSIRMYESIGGKLTGLTLVINENNTEKIHKIPITLRKINNLIGVSISESQVEEYLKRLNFELSDKIIENDEISWVVTPPFYRLDVDIEEDVIEEVARIYGYENIQAKSLSGNAPQVIDQKIYNLINKLKLEAVNLGFTEVQSYSYYSTDVIDNLNINKKNLIKVANPISSETEYMRDNLWPNLLETISYNLKFLKDVLIFEIGKVYKKVDNNILEKYVLSLGISNENNHSIKELFYLTKKLLESINLELNIGQFTQGEEKAKLFHPKRSYYLINQKNNEVLGILGEIHPRITDKFNSSNRISIVELEINKFL